VTEKKSAGGQLVVSQLVVSRWSADGQPAGGQLVISWSSAGGQPVVSLFVACRYFETI